MRDSALEFNSEVLVLLSGGVDSAACIAYYLSQGYQPSALFVDYGQPDCEEEWAAARAICDHYQIKLRQASVSAGQVSEGYVPARNALLINLALMVCDEQFSLVAIGIHAGTPYADCTPEFRRIAQNLFDLYCDGRVRLDAPFLTWTKSEILDYAEMQGVPLALTHSTNPL